MLNDRVVASSDLRKNREFYVNTKHTASTHVGECGQHWDTGHYRFYDVGIYNFDISFNLKYPF